MIVVEAEVAAEALTEVEVHQEAEELLEVALVEDVVVDLEQRVARESSSYVVKHSKCTPTF